MAKRTNRVVWGLVVTLLVIVAALSVGAHLFYRVVGIRVEFVGVRFTTTSLVISTIAAMPASDALEAMNGHPIYPWPGQAWYACGAPKSAVAGANMVCLRATQIYRQGDVVKAVCHRFILFPWVKG